jgi:hypothetical protein
VTFRNFILAEERRSEFAILKASRKPLEGDEKAKAMKAGCVWHFTGHPTCAIWKGTDTAGKSWYVSNTHRAYSKDKTLDQAIKRWHNYVEPSA